MKTQLISFTNDHKQGFIQWLEDADSLYRFAGTGFEFPLTLDQIAEYPAKHKAFAYALIDTQGTHVASGDFVEDAENKEARLCRLIVNPKFRGQGYGKQLVEELCAIAHTKWPHYRISLNVLNDNQVAIGLYKKCGFEISDKLFSFDAGGNTYHGFKMYLK